MKSKRLFEEVEDVKGLAQLLSHSSVVSDLEEGWELAHALSDLEESFIACLEVHLPRLKTNLHDPEVKDLLLDMGEDLRHILYQIENTRFYGYLLPPRAKV